MIVTNPFQRNGLYVLECCFIVPVMKGVKNCHTAISAGSVQNRDGVW